MKRYVFCVWEEASDPYAGGPYLIEIFSTEEKAVKYVEDYNKHCDEVHGEFAKYYYYTLDKWEVL